MKYILYFVAGVVFAVALTPILAQVVIKSDETFGGQKLATTTFESLDAYEQTKATINSQKEITDRLDGIIYQLYLLRKGK